MNNTSYPNETEERLPESVERNLQIIASFSTCICILGEFANTLCIIVQHKNGKINKSIRLLKVLTFVDMAVLFLTFISTFSKYIFHGDAKIFYYIFDPVVHLTARTVYNFEIYLTVFISLQRTIDIALPFKSKIYMTKRVINIILFVLAVFTVACNIPYWVGHNPRLEWNSRYNMYLFQQNHAQFLNTQFFDNYNGFVTIGLRCALPMTILIVCNGVLIYTRKRMTEPIGQDDARGGDRLTAMIISITCMSLLTHISSAVFIFYEGSLRLVSLSYAVVIVRTIIVTNCSTNFIFYYILGKNFRKTFKSLFGIKVEVAPLHVNS